LDGYYLAFIIKIKGQLYKIKLQFSYHLFSKKKKNCYLEHIYNDSNNSKDEAIVYASLLGKVVSFSLTFLTDILQDQF